MGITTQNIRLANFLELLRRYNFDKEFSDKIGKSAAYVSQVKKGNKNLGAANAREIEKIFNLPEGWMDIQHESKWSHTEERRLYQNDITTLAGVIASLPDGVRENIRRLVYSIAAETKPQTKEDIPDNDNL